jgi:hypothetical protein
MQIELFEQALDLLEAGADLVNQVVEITMDDYGLHIRRYHLPSAGV